MVLTILQEGQIAVAARNLLVRSQQELASEASRAIIEVITTIDETAIARNFNHRMGKGAQVYLGSAEQAAVCALLGRIPSVDEYLAIVTKKDEED